MVYLSEIYPRSAHFDVLLARLARYRPSHKDCASDEDAQTFAEVMLKHTVRSC